MQGARSGTSFPCRPTVVSSLQLQTVHAWVLPHVSSRYSTMYTWDVVFLLCIQASSLCLSLNEFIFLSVEDGWMGKG